MFCTRVMPAVREMDGRLNLVGKCLVCGAPDWRLLLEGTAAGHGDDRRKMGVKYITKRSGKF